MVTLFRKSLNVWGVSTELLLYHWQSQLGGNKTVLARNASDDSVRIAKLKAELKRVMEERDILKKATRYFSSLPE